MDLNIVCASWIKEEDERVLAVLQQSDHWMSAEALSERTGLPAKRVEYTLRNLEMQRQLHEARMAISDLNA